MPKQPSPAGTSSRLREGRVSEAFGAYSLTKVTAGRKPVFSSDAAAQSLVESLAHLRALDRIKLFAFCVMPDHVHVALCLLPGKDLSDVLSSFSKFTARRINQLLGTSGPLWQEGFYDRHCRDRDELSALSEYIEHNPVRAGLVAAAEDWRYSSASPDQRQLLDREWWP